MHVYVHCSSVHFSPPGSATLHHWQQLAQPHLGVILDARPGVVPKGYRPLELELEQVRVGSFHIYNMAMHVYSWVSSNRHASIRIWAYLQVYPWGGFEEDEPGEQYFQNLPTSSSSASPAVPSTSASTDTNIGQPLPTLALPSPPSPSPSPHLSNTDVLGEDTL